MKFGNTTIKPATILTKRNSKVGYEDHERYIYLTKQLQPCLLLIANSTIAGLCRYQNVCEKYFKHHNTVNSGISGDKTHDVL